MEFCVTPEMGDVPAEAFDALDCAVGVPSCHGRLRQLEADGRWRVRYLRGWDCGQLQAVVPLFAPRARSWPDPAYDPRSWPVPGLTGDDGRPAGSLLVGGCADLRSTLHVRPEVRDSPRFAQVLGQVARVAAEEGRGLVFPYVYEEARDALTRVAGDRVKWEQLGREGVFSGVSDPGWEDRLRSRPRQYLRRDRRLIAEVGVVSEVRPWAEAEDTACELIAAHNVDKGRPDHPDFVRMRFRQWSECAQVECLAFTSRSRTFHGVVAALVWGDDLEMSEIGLAEGEGPERLAVYVDLVFRQAIDYAQRRGLRNIRLGPEAERVKTARGASLRELYGGVIAASATKEIAEKADAP